MDACIVQVSSAVRWKGVRRVSQTDGVSKDICLVNNVALCGNAAASRREERSRSGQDNSNGYYYFALLFYDLTLPWNRYLISWTLST